MEDQKLLTLDEVIKVFEDNNVTNVQGSMLFPSKKLPDMKGFENFYFAEKLGLAHNTNSRYVDCIFKNGDDHFVSLVSLDSFKDFIKRCDYYEQAHPYFLMAYYNECEVMTYKSDFADLEDGKFKTYRYYKIGR